MHHRRAAPVGDTDAQSGMAHRHPAEYQRGGGDHLFVGELDHQIEVVFAHALVAQRTVKPRWRRMQEVRGVELDACLVERIESLVVERNPEVGSGVPTEEQKKFNFDLLSDPRNQTANAYGLVYTLPEDLRKIYLQFGIDVPKHNGDDTWTLPLPARYIIDPKGIVRYAEVNVDYTVRPEPENTIAALNEL